MKLTSTLIVALIFNLFIPTCNAQSSLTTFTKTEKVYSVHKKDSLKLYIFQQKGIKNGIDNKTAVLIFHGGGWSSGKPSWAFNLAQRFAKEGLVGIAVQYRLSNRKDISPMDAMNDAKNAIIWIRKNAKDLNISPDKIIVYGWSAGSHLAASTAVFPKIDKTTGISSIPNAMILSSPALSIVDDYWFNELLPEGKEGISFSPAENISNKLPPSLILVGKEDTVTPVEQAKLFYQNAIKYKSYSEIHIYKNVGHLFTPSNQSDSKTPRPDNETVEKAFAAVDSFIHKLNFIE